ncbi:DUF1638 domain-containing protein [Acetobacterium woodii]|uniref:DUF1638 domain-containing protein n=1 Tax=Acetobacterium woodii (strain ATCC 29683 / DSM 1030 / JCM 2381 / KCTC 1655 / WB1) TaxID=931626 RepID=H6LFE1_ACEWD|nr:DUF1638 domain-containing protein [Acetobacterium woodii]AFA49428.1 hypothetical protein Awo_c26750 [Acetobacterium woodii DSM 1030]
MKRVLIGCGVLRKEIEAFLKDSDIECRWLEEQLHNEPDKLHLEIQEAIDAQTEADLIYLNYGLCGKALLGIQAKSCPIVMPRVEDCIEIILHGRSDVDALRCTSYFVSQGWLWGEDGIGYEHDRVKKKYGEEKALRIARVMFKNYQYLLFIRTGVETNDDRLKCEAMAQKLGLGIHETDGNIHLLEEMMSGVRDDRYIILEPGEELVETRFHNY